MNNGLVFDSLILIWVCRHLSIEKNRYLYIRLFPEPSRFSKEQPPLARFVLRVSNTGLNRKPYISPSMMHPVSVFWLCVYICIMLVFCLSVLCVSDFWVLCGWDVYFCAKKRKKKKPISKLLWEEKQGEYLVVCITIWWGIRDNYYSVLVKVSSALKLPKRLWSLGVKRRA